jgi:hypothetical protein
MTPLHSAVKALAGNSPALVFSLDAFRGFLLNNFTNAVTRLRNASVPIEGFPNIEARFTGLTVNPVDFQVSLSDAGGNVHAVISPGFQSTLALHVAGDPQSEFSTIAIDVANLQVGLTANAPSLMLGSPDFDVQGRVTPSASRAAALAKPGITEEDVVRVEGAMAYVMPRRVVASALATVSSVNLSEHFTAFELRGDWGASRCSRWACRPTVRGHFHSREHWLPAQRQRTGPFNQAGTANNSFKPMPLRGTA